MEKLIFFIRQWIIPPIEILIITLVIYNIWKVFVRTRAMQILKGIVIIVVVFAIAYLLRMEIILVILQSSLQLFAVTIVVIFSQEIRRIFSKLGTNNFFTRLFAEKNPEIIDTITETVEELSDKTTGALIVFEKNIGLKNYIENTGIAIDGLINKELLLTIFFKNTALHDGAVICKGERIIAASVVLPTSTKPDIDKLFGLRHRAGIGVCEESDAIAVIVSEETGKISIANEGKINYNLDITQFKKMFTELLFDIKEIEDTSGFEKILRKSISYIYKKKEALNKWIESLSEREDHNNDESQKDENKKVSNKEDTVNIKKESDN